MIRLLTNACLIGTLFVVIGGCSNSPDDYLRSAQEAIAEGEDSVAIIELKNALSLAPDLADAHLLLAEVYLRHGDYPRALAEFEATAGLWPGDDRVLTGLYRAKLRMGRLDEVIEVLDGNESLAAPLTVILGDAYLAAGELDKAREVYLLEENSSRANLGLAVIRWRENDRPGARSYFLKATELDADYADLWLNRGEFELSSGEFDRAAEAFNNANRFPATRIQSHVGLSRVLLMQGATEEAGIEVAEAIALAPEYPYGHYVAALVAIERDDLVEAETSVRRTLELLPEHTPSLYLMGILRYRQGRHGEAEGFLRQHLEQDPGSGHAARLLMTIYFGADDYQELGHLTMQRTGSETSPDARRKESVQAASQQIHRDALTPMTHIRNNEWDQANDSVDKLVAAYPSYPMGYSLRGIIAANNGDLKAARDWFRKALEKDPRYFPALRNLTLLAEQSGSIDEATVHLEHYLEEFPNSYQALVALADLSLKKRDWETADRHLHQAIQVNPDFVPARIELVRTKFLADDLAGAGQQIDEGLERSPESMELLLLRAEYMIARGDFEVAGDIAGGLHSMLSRRSGNFGMHVRVARLQARLGDTTLAKMNLRRALAIESDANRLEAIRVRSMLADMEFRDGNMRAAGVLYDELRDVQSGAGVVGKARIDVAAGEASRAVERLKTWLDRYPESVGVEMFLAEVLVQVDQDQALRRYEKLAEAGNYIVLNNLALLYLQRQDPRAVGMARRAMEAAPEEPNTLDTLGWVLFQTDGATAEVVRLLRRSVKLDSNNPSVHYHLGIALRETGDKEGARESLEMSLQFDSFQERSDAQRALNDLAVTAVPAA